MPPAEKDTENSLYLYNAPEGRFFSPVLKRLKRAVKG
jgi:hypothetical protein